MNKRGQEKYLSLWNVFIWVIIAGTLVIGISLFADERADVRFVEASFLAEKIADCVYDNPTIEFTQQALLQICKLAQSQITDGGVFGAHVLIHHNEETITDLPLGNVELTLQCTNTANTVPCARAVRALPNDQTLTVFAASNNEGRLG